MKPLNNNVFVKKESPEYTGLLVGVSNDESQQARVLAIGPNVTVVALNEKVLLDWRSAKLINGDLYLVNEKDIVAVIEDE